ncbi:hypoxanthine phosphoribosyltransferase, partial [Vibrio parahaemolyticus]|nr:hypoxanthine phosphoribosyltransferase [Vibrio parahaemolyticus]
MDDQAIKEILITEEEIKKRVKELGDEISKDYIGKEPVGLGILKGAVVFLSDLIREIKIPINIDFMAVSSYGKSSVSTGEVRIIKDLD